MKKFNRLIITIFLLTLFSYLVLNSQEKQKIFLIKKIINYSENDPTAKEEFSYNEEGNELTHLIQKKYNDNFENVIFYETSYNSVGDKIFEQIQKWYGTEWVNDSKTEYDYNEPGVIDTCFHYNWVDGDWALNSVTVYSYNIQKLCTRKETRKLINEFLWGDKLERWEYDKEKRIVDHSLARYDLNKLEYLNSGRIRYKYDSNGLIIETVSYGSDWNGRGWTENMKNSYTYNDNNNNKLLMHLISQYDNFEWIINFKITYSYDIENILTSKKQEARKSYEDHTLYNDFIETYNYENDTIKTITIEIWDEDNWIYDRRITFSYNDNLNEILKSTEVFQNNNWFEKYRCYKTYDNDNNIASIRNQYLDSSDWNNYHTDISVQDSKGRNFSYRSKYAVELDWSFVYFEPPIGIYDERLINLNIYPNPAQDFIRISLDKVLSNNSSIKIYNILGEKCLKIENPEINNNDIIIPVHQLNKGIYFLLVVTKEIQSEGMYFTKFSVVK